MIIKNIFPLILIGSLLLSSNAYGEMIRSTFSTGIANHEPIDSITQAKNDQVIYYFTDLRGLTGHTVLHLWDFNGKQYAVIPFEVKGERWRVYSLKTLTKNLTGHWLVTVFDQTSGKMLGQDSLLVTSQTSSGSTNNTRNSETENTTNTNHTNQPITTMPMPTNQPSTTLPEITEKWTVQPSSHEAINRPIANHLDSLNKDVPQQNTNTNPNQTKPETPTPPKRLPIWDILPR